MKSEIKTYTFEFDSIHGEAFLWHNKIYYNNEKLKLLMEDIFDKLNRLRLKITSKTIGNAVVGGKFLRCTSCYHSILREKGRFCSIFNKYLDTDSGMFCVYHSKKLGTTNKPIIQKLLTFIDEDGALNKEKILEKLSVDINYFSNSFILGIEKELKFIDDQLLYKELLR